MSLIYLAGTENDSKWRLAFIENISKKLIEEFKLDSLEANKKVLSKILFPTPNVELNRIQRGKAKHIVHVLTPRMSGVMNIAEASYDAVKRSQKMSFIVLRFDQGEGQEMIQFDPKYQASLKDLQRFFESEDVKCFENFSELVDHYYPLFK